MKPEYRKWSSFILIGIMEIGLAILLINPIRPEIYQNNIQNGEAEAVQTMREENLSLDISDADTDDALALASSLADLTPSPSPTPIPSPTPFPIYALEKEDYPAEIDSLIQTYYEAKASCDMKTMKSISSNPSAVIEKESLQKLLEGIDEYRNVRCYVKKSYIEREYIIWAYYNIKFIGLDTCAPSLSKLYVVTDEAGNYKIFDGEMDEELRTYFDARSEDEDVKKLMAYTEKMAEKAKAKDKDLSEFWEMLENY